MSGDGEPGHDEGLLLGKETGCFLSKSNGQSILPTPRAAATAGLPEVSLSNTKSEN